jgi:hypothetical protein
MVGGAGGDGKDGMPGHILSALMAMMLASRSGISDLQPPSTPPGQSAG